MSTDVRDPDAASPASSADSAEDAGEAESADVAAPFVGPTSSTSPPLALSQAGFIDLLQHAAEVEADVAVALLPYVLQLGFFSVNAFLSFLLAVGHDRGFSAFEHEAGTSEHLVYMEDVAHFYVISEDYSKEYKWNRGMLRWRWFDWRNTQLYEVGPRPAEEKRAAEVPVGNRHMHRGNWVVLQIKKPRLDFSDYPTPVQRWLRSSAEDAEQRGSTVTLLKQDPVYRALQLGHELWSPQMFFNPAYSSGLFSLLHQPPIVRLQRWLRARGLTRKGADRRAVKKPTVKDLRAQTRGKGVMSEEGATFGTFQSFIEKTVLEAAVSRRAALAESADALNRRGVHLLDLDDDSLAKVLQSSPFQLSVISMSGAVVHADLLATLETPCQH